MNEHEIVARLDSLERRLKRIGAGALGILALGLGAISWYDTGIAARSRSDITTAVTRAQDPEVVTAYHDNGTKAWEATIRNNRYDGLFASWTRNGLRSGEGEYSNGQPHGMWRTWGSLGTTSSFLREKGAYWNGVQTGMWTVWRSEHHKESEGEYAGGERVGEWKFWNRDGSLSEKLTGFYEAGIKVK